MARAIVLNLDGEVSRSGLTRVTRDKVYGKKRRIVVDGADAECTRGMLTVDGATVLASGSTASVTLDGHFTSVERRDLTAVDPVSHEELPTLPSTLDTEQPLSGPVDPRHFLDHVVKSVYELAPDELGTKLMAALGEGQILETRFNYSKGLRDSPLFVLQNTEGVFALVAEQTQFEPCRPDAQPIIDEDEDDPFEDDDLDFGMF